MKDWWVTYPGDLLAAATQTVAGGIVTMFIGLLCGGTAGYLVHEGELYDYEGIWGVVIGLPILSVFKGWGLLYLPTMFYLGYKTLYDEFPRLVAAYWMAVCQTLILQVSFDYQLEENDLLVQPEYWARMGSAILAYGLIAWAYVRIPAYLQRRARGCR